MLKDVSQDCQNALSNFEKLGKWGYQNNNGEVIISPKYEIPADFQNGRALVRREGAYCYIDETGKEYEI